MRSGPPRHLRFDMGWRWLEQEPTGGALESNLRVVVDDAPQIAQEPLLDVPRVRGPGPEREASDAHGIVIGFIRQKKRQVNQT